MSKIIAKEWRSGIDCVGIIATKDERTGKCRAYIGVAKNNDEETDAEYIHAHGAKLSKNEALAFFPDLATEEFDE